MLAREAPLKGKQPLRRTYATIPMAYASSWRAIRSVVGFRFHPQLTIQLSISGGRYLSVPHGVKNSSVSPSSGGSSRHEREFDSPRSVNTAEGEELAIGAAAGAVVVGGAAGAAGCVEPPRERARHCAAELDAIPASAAPSCWQSLSTAALRTPTPASPPTPPTMTRDTASDGSVEASSPSAAAASARAAPQPPASALLSASSSSELTSV
ncbi:uncharacterized protein Tco025E_02395 [Trypanosoma conorhini]|uniref:Uncharacterized protein n=1 Tax=Trypanosoma conorhini TaxID=83891 RepID=A0A422Q4M7_9TRYP|nr:uncharacterized protein Tco025E_02395 [Trypanosoma conorhini]RNF24919.1 hypothetical protein Tco025E_02395 [Trypanosoma conorhini]